MDVYLDKVLAKDKDILYRLLEYSLFEESEFDLNEMNNEGIFEYIGFDNYFIDNYKEAFFIRDKKTNKLLGFAMLNTDKQSLKIVHSIVEYMVIPKYRKTKIGKRVAFEIFNKHRGNWIIEPSLNSQKAYLFWKNVISDYTNNNYQFKEEMFIFNNSI